MVKSEFIERIINKFAQLSAEETEQGVYQILECMSEALSKNKRIEVRGFGGFSLHYRPARNAHNPKTGEKVITGPKYRPHFKPGKQMRERVNESRLKGVPIMLDTIQNEKA